MFNSNLIATLSLVVLLNYLNASVNNISNIINDMSVLIDDIKNRYISLKHDIFSPANSVITNFDTYSESLLVLSKQLNICKYENFERLLELDIEKKYIDKISKLKIEFDLLNNSISILYYINKYHNTSYKKNLNSFEDYKTKVRHLIKFENLMFQME